MAYKKKCPECGQYSYSTSKDNLWRCNTCKADITHIEAIPAEGDRNENKRSG